MRIGSVLLPFFDFDTILDTETLSDEPSGCLCRLLCSMGGQWN